MATSDRDAPDAPLAAVTGASSGIGLAVALGLAGAGWRVVALGRRAEPPEALARLPGVRYGAADLACEDAARVLARVAPDAATQLRAAIHCAGHDLGGGRPFHTHDPDAWRNGLQVNLEAAMRFAQACLPALLARPQADLVFIGSITARRTAAGLAAYSAAKHAVKGFARALRADYAATGLRVTEVAPGVVRSGFASGRLHADSAAAAFYDGFAQCLEPQDVARAVLWALAQPPHVCVAELTLLPTKDGR